MNQHIAWHYTTAQKFLDIAADGWLDPKYTVTPVDERPIMWFSTAAFWERTAQKMATSSEGEIITLGMQETFQNGKGLVRFGIDKRQLIPWPELGQRAGMSQEMINAIDSVGREQGASPEEWLGTFERIPIRDCIIGIFDDETKTGTTSKRVRPRRTSSAQQKNGR